MALLLMHADATVTVCHSRTRELEDVCREADILVAAIGRAGLVRAEHVKPGAVVVDVGMNRVTDPAQARELAAESRLAQFERRGYVLVGDVHEPSVAAGRRRAHAGAWRRRAADDRHAAAQHRRRRRGPPSRPACCASA